MSIILEALKKATKETPAEPIEIEKSYEAAEPELKKPAIQAPESNLPRLTRSTIISLAIIAIGGFLLFFLLRESGLPVAVKSETRAQPTSLTLNGKPAQAAEGYSPVSIFKIKALNPRLTLNGIVSGIGKPAAIIDNKIVEEGASINGAKVVKIYNDKVELRNDVSGEIFTLRVY
jgi:hypothetical protein